MSLRQLAKQVGVSQPSLSQIRTGKRPVPEALSERLEALGAYHLLITDKQDSDTDTRPSDSGELSVRTVGGNAEGQSRTADTWIFSWLDYQPAGTVLSGPVPLSPSLADRSYLSVPPRPAPWWAVCCQDVANASYLRQSCPPHRGSVKGGGVRVGVG